MQKTQSNSVIENILLVIAEAVSSTTDGGDDSSSIELVTESIREVFSNPMVCHLIAEMTEIAIKIARGQSDNVRQDREILVRMMQSTRFALGLDIDGDTTFSDEFISAIERGSGENMASADDASAERMAFDNFAEADPDLCSVFVSQHRESLEVIEAAIMAIENGEGEDLGEVRRALHTMKGDAGLVGLREIETRSHRLEDELEVEGIDISNKVLAFVDWVRASIDMMVAHFSGEELPEHVKPAPVSEVSEPEVAVPECLTADAEITADFVTEATEILESVEEMLLTLEADRTHQETLHAVFRAFHSIKGVSSFLELGHIRDLAHGSESLLDLVRAGKMELTDERFEAILTTFDWMRRFIADVQRACAADGKLTPEPELPKILQRLKAVRENDSASAPAPTPAAQESAAPASSESPSESKQIEGVTFFDEVDETPNEPATKQPEKEVAIEAAPPAKKAAEEKPKAPAPKSPKPAASKQSGGIQETIRVEPARLDRLVDSIGELVIAESMVTKTLENQESSQLSHLRKITRELQELAMSLRMVPLRSTFRRMARLARDVAKKLGKRIDFTCVGEEAELDKTMVDAIGDPLMHMIRNAVDHGLEDTPAERRENGKDEIGNVTLRAYHEGGSIYIEVSDDGAGMNRDAIIQKAIDRGILNDGDSLTDTEAFGLVFEPGFSTAKKVSEVSGRGVGLDVVKRSIEALRGHVEIRSTPGEGTTFSMRLPLTLAIIDGMVVRIGHERFVIPTLDIVRIVRRRDVDTTQVFDRAPVIRIGEELIPLIDLGRDLRSADDRGDDGAFVVVDSSDNSVAIAVDELIGQQQIVIKSLGSSLAEARGFAGGTIMPDGRVSLILDIAGLMTSKRGGQALVEA